MTQNFFDAPHIGFLPDGKRVTMRHGPIELVVEAFGDVDEVKSAYRQAARCFDDVLPTLVGELDVLRREITAHSAMPVGPVATAMHMAAKPFAEKHFITPMVAVAGSVADFVLQKMVAGRALHKAYVNNGGDIALYIGAGQNFEIGICANNMSGEISSAICLDDKSAVRGLATSGWRGRSHSLGIADAVTVLAKNAATADAAATLIANHITLADHPSIERAAADTLSPDSDLGAQLVTTDVGVLSKIEVQAALRPGAALAQTMVEAGLIIAAYGSLQGENFALRAEQSGALLVEKPSENLNHKKINDARLMEEKIYA